ncbi:MAG TPA: hypothetical protein VN802_19300 [Stellaceae bacterium]|nr:hypothetical protein [Stellaceae bacterium]
MTEHDPWILRQQDLSRLRLQEMTPVERAELLRRYSEFVDHFRVGEPPAPPKPKRVKKWLPGKSLAPTK